ncbi:hypothetical protein STEG23_036527, partial [Scotinomys teguina]
MASIYWVLANVTYPENAVRLSYVEPSLHLWDKAYLVMVDNVFDVFLESICQYFIEYLCIYVHEEDCCYISIFISDFINLDALSLPFDSPEKRVSVECLDQFGLWEVVFLALTDEKSHFEKAPQHRLQKSLVTNALASSKFLTMWPSFHPLAMNQCKYPKLQMYSQMPAPSHRYIKP